MKVDENTRSQANEQSGSACSKQISIIYYYITYPLGPLYGDRDRNPLADSVTMRDELDPSSYMGIVHTQPVGLMGAGTGGLSACPERWRGLIACGE